MYEPEAVDLLNQLGIVVEQASAREDGSEKTIPIEGVQALSAAMSLLGGNSGVTAEVGGQWFCSTA